MSPHPRLWFKTSTMKVALYVAASAVAGKIALAEAFLPYKILTRKPAVIVSTTRSTPPRALPLPLPSSASRGDVMSEVEASSERRGSDLQLGADAGVGSFTATSLASFYVVHIGAEGVPGNYAWNLTPIDCDPEAKTKNERVEDLALEALQSSPHVSSKVYSLNCIVMDADDDTPSKLVVTLGKSQESPLDQDDSLLIDILSRIMLQWVAAQDVGNQSSIIVASVLGEDIRLDKSDLLGDNPKELFRAYLEDNSQTEMSEMVESKGNKLGVVPRPLVHKLNLLHRGIGIVVSKDAHIKLGIENPSEVYVHQRTDCKSIFPSLYDMFVGGVSTAGENARMTAAREVAEELGLKRALEDPEGDALRGPLFNCIICTSYNRCVVTLFTYRFDTSTEQVKWQEEEVQWGDFVPYALVERAAELSIYRWKKDSEGGNCAVVFPSTLQREKTPNEIDYGDGSWRSWDFVPDGLLVWESWVRWRGQDASNAK